jgi:hypothetical protein
MYYLLALKVVLFNDMGVVMGSIEWVNRYWFGLDVMLI